jgi:hypothetical protein
LVGQNRSLGSVARALVDAVESVAMRSIAGIQKLDPATAGQLITGPTAEKNNGIS